MTNDSNESNLTRPTTPSGSARLAGDVPQADNPRATGVLELDDTQIRERVVADLERARARTRGLTDVLDDAELVRQHSRLMSPLVWDLAHIGNQEELWLLRDVGGKDPILPETVDQLYDAFQHPRADRPRCPCWTLPNRGPTCWTSGPRCSTCSSAPHSVADGSPNADSCSA